MDKKKKEKLYDLEGNVINLYQVVELKKEYTEEAFPAYGYYGILVVTLDNGDKISNLKLNIGPKESSLDDAYRNVQAKIDEIRRLLEKLA
jgi:hypothetical protein